MTWWFYNGTGCICKCILRLKFVGPAGKPPGKFQKNVGIMPSTETKYDETLMAMLQQHAGDMDFMNTIFGFMQRRTACFNGPKVSLVGW